MCTRLIAGSTASIMTGPAAEPIDVLHTEKLELSNTATMFQTENRNLQEQNELLQGQVQKLLPPPAEEVEPEPPPRRRRWYYGWRRAT